MAAIVIPQHGLELLRAPCVHATSIIKPKPLHIIQLEITEDMVKDMMQKPSQLSLGETPAILTGPKVRHVTIKPIPDEIKKMMYSRTLPGSMAPIGQISHKVELPSAQTLDLKYELDVLALQRGYKEHEQKKQSNTTIFVKDASKLLPQKGGRRTGSKPGPLAALKSHRVGLFDSRNAAATRSMPASPSLAAAMPSTIPPDPKQIKAEALKTALVHLLAIRPVSERFICSSLHCTTVDVKELLDKYGNKSRLGTQKFELSDKGYKLLDVWKFPYRAQEDRKAAIERAIKSYDRQRISVKDDTWERLLPVAERGKGQILSNLSLHEGPIQRVRTPRINVQGAEEAKSGGEVSGTDSDNRKGRLAPADAQPIARSRSQDPIKKQRVSEKEAQTRRLLSKNPKKASQAVIPKVKPASKKEPKKVTTSDPSKVKSAEFVRDSDEDVEMEDAVTLKDSKTTSNFEVQATKAKTLGTKKPVVNKAKEQKPPLNTSAVDNEKKPAPGGLSSSSSTHKFSEASQASSTMQRTLSHKRSTSSPMKPSPLGSSPPANASDFDNENSVTHGLSSSPTSPVVTVRHENATTKTHWPVRPSNKPAQAIPEHGGSDRGLKRKANDLDSHVHNHGDAASPDGFEPPTKRHQTLPDSPPTSDSNNSVAPGISKRILDLAAKFKDFHRAYSKAHHEIADLSHPPQDMVEKLLKMRGRLEEMKAEISKAVTA
ncbi:hypothetical protein MMC13_008290 [Lambiella insularis]|nr:hypothetical protein [Lambiella insularis]